MDVLLDKWNQWQMYRRDKGISWRRTPYSETGGEQLQQTWLPESIASKLNETSVNNAAFYAVLLADIPNQMLAVDDQSSVAADKHYRVLDIGCKNFFYVSSLYFYLSPFIKHLKIEGLEVDTGRLYRNLYRRRDYAQYYCDSLNAVINADCAGYYQGNWLNWQSEQYQLITVFFPFLFSDLNDGWGLPRNCFSPQDFYLKCAQQSQRVLFFHQGEEEMICSKALIEDLIQQRGKGEVLYQGCIQENDFVERKQPVYSLLWLTG